MSADRTGLGDGAAVELVIEPRRRPVGAGEVRRLLPFRLRRMVGPFIFADLMGPDDIAPGGGVAIDAHPHIGLSTVTYLFDGRLVHRDSTGAVQTIEPGAVNWMTAGSGVAHTERSHPDDVGVPGRLFGLQTWVALPAEGEETAPSFQHVGAERVPVERFGDSEVRVVVGSGWGHGSPVVASSPLVLASIDLVDGSAVPVPADHPERAVAAVDGPVALDGHVVEPGQLVVLRRGSTPTLTGRGRAVVLGGEPVGRRHIWWNFVSSDPERIEQAKGDWAAQRFPLVPGDHDPWVPLPG
ncbi:MAG: pirin family protein [Actinomycetota bacterium]